MADSAGLLFRIKSEYDNAGTTQATTDIKGLEAATSSAASALGGPLTVAAGIAAAAVTAVAAACVSAAVGLFNMAERASELGSRLFDVQQKTGLAAATLSTLDLAARSSGSSFDAVGNSVSKFNVLLGQANAGNEKARATLEQYGITAKDTDGALQQAVKTIGSMSDETEQAAATAALFKDKTGQLIPVIKQLGGDLAGATEDAKKLGLTLTESDLKAADDFGDSLGVLKQQVQIAGAAFALQFAPVLTEGMQAVSKKFAENKDTVRQWGQNVADAMRGVQVVTRQTVGVFQQLDGAFRSLPAGAQVAVGALNRLVAPLLLVYDLGRKTADVLRSLGGAGGGARAGAGVNTSASGGAGLTLPTFGGGGGGGGGRGGGGGGRGGANDADKVERERIQGISENAQREIAVNQNKLDEELARYKFYLANKDITDEQYLLLKQARERNVLDAEIDILNRELEAVGNNAKARQKIEDELDDRISKRKVLVINQEAERKEQAEKKWIAYLKEGSDELERQIKLAGERLKVLEQTRKEIENTPGVAKAPGFDANGQPNAQIPGVSDGGGFFDAIFGDGSQLEQITANTDTLKGVLSEFGSFVGDIFGQMAQAVGQSIASWVLYGGSIGKALKQATAAVLAQVAAQAAVKAIFELAEGFAMLFNPPAAAAHFTAAAIYGGVAAIAGLSGRALAGNSFKGAAAGGGASAKSTSSSSRDTKNQGGIYSAFGNDALISDQSVNRPSPFNQTVTLNIRSNDSHIVEVIEKDANNNGKTRGLILNIAAT